MEPRPALAWVERDHSVCLRLTGLDSVAPGFDFAVLPGELNQLTQQHQPMAGHFEILPGGVDFIPRYPFAGGVVYSWIVPPCRDFTSGTVLALQREMAAIAPTAEVTAIYPSTEIVPFNLLKLYVHFSEPMAEGATRGGVRISNARSGEDLENVFLDMEPELWDPERRRLTLLLDPGRIKRGLAPHEQAGYPLKEDVAIRITIGAKFHNAAGVPLRSAFSRTYAVGPALRRPIHSNEWRVDAPDEGSSSPLTIAFDRPLDQAMLVHAFDVLDAAGASVAGSGAILEGEMGWAFTPSQAWRPGEHLLIVRARLEDLAGNSLRRVFDRDLTRDDDFVTQAEYVALSFRCRAAAAWPVTTRQDSTTR